MYILVGIITLNINDLYKMRKFVTLVIVALVLLVCSCQQNSGNVNNERNEWKLRGAVKTLSEIDYSKNGKYKAWLLFNPTGFIQEQTTYNPDGSLIRKWIYTNNQLNQKLTRHCYVLKDSLSGILHYAYNQHGKITHEKLVTPAGLPVSDVEYQYDKDMNMIEKRFSDAKGKIVVRVKNKFDNNKLIEELQLDSIGQQKGKNRYSYNSNGLNIEMTSFSLQDNVIKSTRYIYLENKQVGQATLYNQHGEINSKIVYKYDNQGNVTIKQTYNLQGELTEKRTYTYKYDDQHNWIFRYEYLNDHVEDIISRKLEYYK